MKLNKKRSSVLLLSIITILSITGCGGDGENGASSNRNLLYEPYLPIYYPGQPINLTNPGNPTDPINPIVPPTNPTDPSNPVVPPTNPTDPSNPVVPPTNPTDPSNPVVPPTNPTDPSNPIVPPTNPTDPSNPVVPPTNPTDPSNPIVPPTNPTDPSNPVVPPVGSSNNLPPVAIAEAYPASVTVSPDDPPVVITLDGSDSYDQDTLIQPITHIWTTGPQEVRNDVAMGYAGCSTYRGNCDSDICQYSFTLEVFDGELSDTANVTVTVDYSNCSDVEPSPPIVVSCEDLIKSKPDSVYITNDPETVDVNKSKILHIWGVYESQNGGNCELPATPPAQWRSEDEAIVTVGQHDFTVVGVSAGDTIITLDYQGLDATSVVHVVE